ncbi:MAG: DUF3859 domain-containing protein [Bacteroidetes bacterium]|nr:DUF3859 domain-containing protein [Bacteroidota bacterium]
MLRKALIVFACLGLIHCSVFRHKAADVVFSEMNHGLYQTQNEDVLASDSAMATDSIHYKFLEQVDTIPALTGTSFGMEYKVTSTSAKEVTLKRVWVFPYPMKDKKGRRYERWENKMRVSVNETHFTYYKFVKHYELLKGKWKLQFYQGDKLIYERAFIVK